MDWSHTRLDAMRNLLSAIGLWQLLQRVPAVDGDAREWKKIYSANAHLLDDTHVIAPGQKIVLP